eukprot:NODE_3480_length_781_cov_619.016529.p1 GENE.NODE_3480_length_781_cov_619.016529~~NODE_3480_length_781_cov_619.016529.p1  ORF type:complete len:192 (-),score=44.74 NODE_3480_length_781_cov_619.016529:205-723(-)
MAKKPPSKGPGADPHDDVGDDDAKRGVQVTQSGEVWSAKWAMPATTFTSSTRKLVSPSFAMGELPDVRIMFEVDGKLAKQAQRSSGSRDGGGGVGAKIQLKVLTCPYKGELEFFLIINSEPHGPFRHDFANNIVSGASSFGADCFEQAATGKGPIVEVQMMLTDGGLGERAS